MFFNGEIKQAFPGYDVISHHGTPNAEQALLHRHGSEEWAIAVMQQAGDYWRGAAVMELGHKEALNLYLFHLTSSVKSSAVPTEPGAF